ncbi:hypothetical protein [Alienimonas chondri]|uniref:Uncharacterized protein n=1 Tax=Alienimonas chondri TaxID=2681879 RepID=A0ABX1VK67_9PLAN|nr:hypothetical protein [Alienimonas chondri]NNJ28170.1 hypothetical protein [Alienimonas chondri]
MRTRTNAALIAVALPALFAATTAVSWNHEHEEPPPGFVPHLAVDALGVLAARWNGSAAQGLYRRWDGHLGALCANPSHRH